tara:strand:- start:8198 stop:8479 length:282 start_codon:yes stop_codon:yes gene_type:complete
MKTIIPAIQNEKEIRFDFETEMGNHYTISITKKFMRVFKMVHNEYSGDWMDGEVGGTYITEEVEDLRFSNLDTNPVSFKTMQSMFVFPMFFAI